MFVITFYSYKGGVGRTMALANVAATLAKRGKRVLAIDFDLEAPTLPNYGCFSSIDANRGIVDYVSEYRRTLIAPDVTEYIQSCELSGEKIWLLPAGNNLTNEYTEKLARIDWQELYENEMGFLLFEDMKQQLAQFEGIGFDYVLIDSRTGHTDVGGICTRQLPNLVVLMFIPTLQNISGLRPIVAEIRAESNRRVDPDFSISLEFCASNVPHLDDEQDILTSNIELASQELGFSSDELSIVHHYDSLSILSHELFVESRPNSRLSKEFNSLSERLASHNIHDERGVKVLLRKEIAKLNKRMSSGSVMERQQAQSRANNALANHPRDGGIAALVAQTKSKLGDVNGEIDALEKAVKYGDSPSRYRILRSRALRLAERSEEAAEELRKVLEESGSTDLDIATAFRMLRTAESDFTQYVEKILSREDLGLSTLSAVAEAAQQDRKNLSEFSEKLLSEFRSSTADDMERGAARNNLVVALIGCGRYADAISTIQVATGDTDYSRMQLPDAFNFFIADWGLSGAPDIGLVEHWLERVDLENSKHRGSNYMQCIALWASLVGDSSSAEHALEAAIKNAPEETTIFSCLSYLYLRPSKFIEEQKSALECVRSGVSLKPHFFSEV